MCIFQTHGTNKKASNTHTMHSKIFLKYLQNIFKIFKMCHLSIRDPAERWKRNERSTSWWHQRYILIRDEKGTFGGHLFSKISSRAIRYTPTSKSKYLSLIVELICPRVYQEELKFVFPIILNFHETQCSPLLRSVTNQSQDLVWFIFYARKFHLNLCSCFWIDTEDSDDDGDFDDN